MKPRSEQEICDAASMLLFDPHKARWSPDHLATIFSIGLTFLGLDRASEYGEHSANRLIAYMVKHALNGCVDLAGNTEVSRSAPLLAQVRWNDWLAGYLRRKHGNEKRSD